MDSQSHPDRLIVVRDLDAPAPDDGADEVRDGFLGGLIERAAPVIRPVASVAPSEPAPE